MQEQLELPVKHYFSRGMYGRELFIPAGSLIVGKIHKHEHLAIQAYGDMTIWSAQEGRARLQGYHMMASPPGMKRVGYAHSDSMWINVHATNETDLDALELELIEPDDVGAIGHYADLIELKLGG